MKEENKMACMPINKLMLSMGVPIVLSMVLQAVYNIVDSGFVANLAENGEEALNALTLAFPFQMLMVAIGIGTGVGANAFVSKSLGQNRKKKASKAAGNAVFLGVIIYILYLLFGIFGVRTYIESQTSNPIILNMAIDYLGICCVFSFGVVFFAIYEKLLQSTGHTLCSTIAQILGAVANIVLDPIFIFGLLGCPEMGVRGAAYATIIGQMVSAVSAFIFHIKYNKDISNKLIYMKPSLKIIKEIYSIGLPAIISQALMSVMTYSLNIILDNIGETMVTAYGLYYKIQQFVLFAAFGLRDAITPIISFSYGMGNKQRIKDGIKYGLIYTLSIMLIGLIIIEIFATPFSKLFGLSGETETLCIGAMRVISISLLFAGANIAFQGIFQALNSGMESLIISVCRQLIFIIPLIWIFANIFSNISGNKWQIWSAFIISELLTSVIAYFLMKKVYKNKIKVFD